VKVGDIVQKIQSGSFPSVGVVIRSPYKKYLAPEKIVEVLIGGSVQYILEKNLKMISKN